MSRPRYSKPDPLKPTNEFDSQGIPLKPTWSVHTLLSTYPAPKISSQTLTRLHELSALLPPEEDSEEFKILKKEMEELVRLVEAVKLVDTSQVQTDGVPDGRIWKEGRGVDLDRKVTMDDGGKYKEPSGQELLKHAQETDDGYYVVESLRNPKR
jgi:Asp-tRNA(Asn)/Glu-tRNA(Gln) amidotransferase C subunit